MIQRNLETIFVTLLEIYFDMTEYNLDSCYITRWAILIVPQPVAAIILRLAAGYRTENLVNSDGRQADHLISSAFG